jgi:hypothetical protein
MEKGDSELVGSCTLLCGNGYHELGTRFFIHKGLMRAEFVDDGMSY